MKLFEISTGALINPLFVASVEVVEIDAELSNKYAVKFSHAGGGYQHGIMTTKKEADNELLAFKEMFESINM